MPNDKEETRRGALAVEHYIDRQLESLGVPIPLRVCAVESDMEHSGSMEILYTCRTGTKVSVALRVDELRCFRRGPMSETLAKVQQLVIEIHEVQAGGKSRSDTKVDE